MTGLVNRARPWLVEALDLFPCALIVVVVAVVIVALALSASVVTLVMLDEFAWWFL